MIAKFYLGLVAAIYFGLALWCVFAPDITSKKVGFQLDGGSGQSEFMTVYGGLEFGIALVLLIALWHSKTTGYGVLACVAIHASLVVFRTISLIIYNNIGSFTYQLAIGEWVVLLLGLFVWYWHTK